MQSNNRPRILIVDDTPKNIQVLGTILRQENYHIHIAQNGVQALNVAREAMPDLILLDVMMPEMDGFEACKQLKVDDKTRHIPIIFLTAKAELENILHGFELGAVDYVTKPFNAMELLVRIRNHLELKISRDTVQRISNQRRELVHILCHDLGNSIGTVLSLLEIATAPEEYANFHHLMNTSARNGMALIQMVRQMEALEEYKLPVRAVNLFEAVRDSAIILDNRFSEKNVLLEFDINPDLKVRAEPVSLVNSVINNLFTNAIKFSYPASKIMARAVETPTGVDLSIRDFGIGIPQRMLDELFDLSKTSSRAGTGGETGTGFGMPLVKKFVTAYGGSMEIFSWEEKQYATEHGTEIVIHFLREE
jgi:DNA-binding response OmpR family regulator